MDTPCIGGKVIYAWAKNAKQLVLPKRKLHFFLKLKYNLRNKKNSFIYVLSLIHI